MQASHRLPKRSRHRGRTTSIRKWIRGKRASTSTSPAQSKENVPDNYTNELSKEELHSAWAEPQAGGLPDFQRILDERTFGKPANIGSMLLQLGSRPFNKRLLDSKEVRDWWLQQIPSQITSRSRSNSSCSSDRSYPQE